MRNKIRYVFLPFVYLLVAFVGGYTFLDWLLTVKLDVMDIYEDITAIWIPLVGAVILVPVFLWKYIDLLKLRPERRNKLLYPIRHCSSFYTCYCSAVLYDGCKRRNDQAGRYKPDRQTA